MTERHSYFILPLSSTRINQSSPQYSLKLCFHFCCKPAFSQSFCTIVVHAFIQKHFFFLFKIYFLVCYWTNKKYQNILGFPGDTRGKNLPANAGDMRQGFDPWVRKVPGMGNGNPLQYFYLEKPMDQGVCWATVHGVAQSQTWLKQLSMYAWNILGHI